MEYLEIGRLKKPYGLQGDLRISIEDQFWSDILKTEVLFVEIKGQKIPYFLEGIKDGTEILVKFEDVDNKETASRLSNKLLFLRSTDISSETAEQLSFEAQLPEWIGYVIWTEDGTMVGPITDLIDMPMQVLAAVNYNNKELLIPMVEEFIVEIVSTEKKLIMSLPDGMLNL